MKVLVFSSEHFEKSELEEMTQQELLELAYDNSYYAQVYDSEKDFQFAFNNDSITDQSYIYFIETADIL